MPRNLRNLRGISYLESLIAIAFVTLLLFAIGRLVDPGPEPTADGPDFREALSLAQAELEVLATLAPEDVARQVPVGERITVVGGSLLPERDRRGAISIDGRRVAWRPTCDGLKPVPGDACPGIYRRIERLDGATTPEQAYHVTIVVAWPDPERPKADSLRRVDLQARVG